MKRPFLSYVEHRKRGDLMEKRASTFHKNSTQPTKHITSFEDWKKSKGRALSNKKK